MDAGIGATLTTFATEMLALSIAAERVTETVKQSVTGVTSKLSPQLQPGLIQAMAMLSAMFVVALSHADPLGAAKGCAGWLRCRQGWDCIAFTGILASGGSAV